MHKILVVDDKLYVRLSLKILLQEKSMASVEAETVPDALHLLQRDSEIDLVITDLLMPEFSGLDFIRFVRTHYPDLPVLAVSGGGDTAQGNLLLQEAREIAHWVLKKPFTPEQLYAAMEKAAARLSRNSAREISR